MGNLRQSLRLIPYWAYLLVFVVVCANSIRFIYMYQTPVSGETSALVNGHWIVNYIGEDSPVSKTEIRIGDTLVSCNGYPLEEWFSCYHGQKTGDTLIFGILRNTLEVGIPVIVESYYSEGEAVAWTLLGFSLLFSLASLYLLVKRPGDNAVWVFFIYFQMLMTVAPVAIFTPFPVLLPVMATMVFIFCINLYGIVLIHFHLLFPKPALIYMKFRHLPTAFYTAGVLLSIYFFISYLRFVYIPSAETDEAFTRMIRHSLYWDTVIFLTALAIAVYQYRTIKDTLARNQLMLLIIGSFFVFLPLVSLTFFYEWIVGLQWPYLIEMSSTAGNAILILCILVAIFRFRIWHVEVVVRKVLLYLVATVIITLSYLMMIWLVDQFLYKESTLTRFMILGVSVIVFLALRDRIQRLIDRIFHRESYDSATVVSDFEAKMAGIYRFDELKQKIPQSIDDIFHFNSFMFNLKNHDLIYEPVYVFGINDQKIGSDHEINSELEGKLRKSTVFSPDELGRKPAILEIFNGDLIVPLVSDGEPNGFFICGRKKSHRIYSRQDINVLTLLARRVIALLNTASLFQKDLDRQLMLERERSRISQDMHDDVGASLTRISILSELAKNNADKADETKQWLSQISDTSRGVMEEMSQIIWALNPKNDTLAGLVAYIRRFANEYLETASVRCTFDLPEAELNLALRVEVRRNIYLVVREALHNVVKHAAATEVGISMKLNKYEIIITIKDNGKGFNPGNLEFPGNGLINMKRRLSDINGEFRVRSKVGEGTELELLLFGDRNQ